MVNGGSANNELFSYSVGDNDNQVLLNVAPFGGYGTWTGKTNGHWDLATGNWATGAGTDPASPFKDAMGVTFDDTAARPPDTDITSRRQASSPPT